MGKISRSFNGEYTPRVENHDILNFKNIKRLSFKNLKKEFIKNFEKGDCNKIFQWANHNNYLPKDSHETYLESYYNTDYTKFLYRRINNFNPICFSIDKDRCNPTFMTDFFKYLSPPAESCIFYENYGSNDLTLTESVTLIEKDLIMHNDSNFIFFYLNPDKHLRYSEYNAFWWILRLLASYKKNSSEKNKIHIVYRGEYGFDKQAFDVKKVKVDIDLNYNDGFKPISEKIIDSLNKNKSAGLYILSGEPGVGKTTYLRYLAGKVKRNIIFVSPDMVNHITEPAFIPFLMNNSDSVLIIEDGEPALEKRDGALRHGAISNILNLTDGLLSDCLNISIVVTFNTKTKKLDDALLRKGRLIHNYQFEPLCAEKSKKLLEKLGHNVDVKNPMTVAEIYNYGKDDNSSGLLETKPVGFKQST